MAERFSIVTGGLGWGKTNLVAALARAGIATVGEAGRAVIQEQVASGGNALPWADRAAFAEAMLARDVQSHRDAAALAGPVVFDRGAPDVLGYLALCGLRVPPAARRTVRALRYSRTVFIAPHWPAIFTQDAERRQDEAEAAATHAVMADTYRRLGYDLVALPFAGIAERVAFVRERIGV